MNILSTEAKQAIVEKVLAKDGCVFRLYPITEYGNIRSLNTV